MLNRHNLIEGYYKVVKAIVSHSPLAKMNPNSISFTASIIGVIAAIFFMFGHIVPPQGFCFCLAAFWIPLMER